MIPVKKNRDAKSDFLSEQKPDKNKTRSQEEKSVLSHATKVRVFNKHKP